MKIKQTLIKIKDDVKPLLIEMFPNSWESIEFAYEDNFREWLAMLFDLQKWYLRSDIISIEEGKLFLQTNKLKKVREELVNYTTLEDYDFISVVLMGNELHLIDGYHRVLKARDSGIAHLKGCVWEKAPNKHPNCAKIRELIIKNL